MKEFLQLVGESETTYSFQYNSFTIETTNVALIPRPVAPTATTSPVATNSRKWPIMTVKSSDKVIKYKFELSDFRKEDYCTEEQKQQKQGGSWFQFNYFKATRIWVLEGFRSPDVEEGFDTVLDESWSGKFQRDGKLDIDVDMTVEPKLGLEAGHFHVEWQKVMSGTKTTPKLM